LTIAHAKDATSSNEDSDTGKPSKKRSNKRKEQHAAILPVVKNYFSKVVSAYMGMISFLHNLFTYRDMLSIAICNVTYRDMSNLHIAILNITYRDTYKNL